MPRDTLPDMSRADAARALRTFPVVEARHEPGDLPLHPDRVVLTLQGGGFAVLCSDPEGNPGGALHVMDADGKLVGVIS